jgi:hypothetical protein
MNGESKRWEFRSSHPKTAEDEGRRTKDEGRRRGGGGRLGHGGKPILGSSEASASYPARERIFSASTQGTVILAEAS